MTLFFKSLVALADLYILRKEGFVPSSHTHRFRITQEKFSIRYDLLDKDFPYYQESYTKQVTKDMVEVIKDDIEQLKKTLSP